MQDNIIPFKQRARDRASRHETPARQAHSRRPDTHPDKAYLVAHDIQRELSSRFAFDVMLKGMPHEGSLLLKLTERLRDALVRAASEHGDAALHSLRGVHVFFSGADNEVRNEHGYRSLHLSNEFSVTEVSALVTQMIRARQSH